MNDIFQKMKERFTLDYNKIPSRLKFRIGSRALMDLNIWTTLAAAVGSITPAGRCGRRGSVDEGRCLQKGTSFVDSL